MELPKSIEDLKRQLIGFQSYQSSKNGSAKGNYPDVNPLLLQDSGKEENSPYIPPLNPEDSYKEENDPDLPPLTSTYNGEEDNDLDLTPLLPVYSANEGKTSDATCVTYRGSTLDLGSQAVNLF